MIAELPDTVLATFIIFCRIGACLMLVPGYSSTNAPAQIRLFVALAVTLAIAPLLLSSVRDLVVGAAPLSILSLIWSELLIGVVIGLTGRLFFLALQTMATAMATAVGLSNIPGTPVDEADPVPALVPLITVSAAALFFLTNQQWEVLRGLVGSYRVWRPAEGLSAEAVLIQLSDRLSETFLLALRVSSPFVIYALIVNLAIGLANKFTPSIPIYFISLPFVIFGGLVLLYLTSYEMLLEFTTAFSQWLAG